MKRLVAQAFVSAVLLGSGCDRVTDLGFEDEVRTDAGPDGGNPRDSGSHDADVEQDASGGDGGADAADDGSPPP